VPVPFCAIPRQIHAWIKTDEEKGTEGVKKSPNPTARPGLAPLSLIETLTNNLPVRRGQWCLSPFLAFAVLADASSFASEPRFFHTFLTHFAWMPRYAVRPQKCVCPLFLPSCEERNF